VIHLLLHYNIMYIKNFWLKKTNATLCRKNIIYLNFLTLKTAIWHGPLLHLTKEGQKITSSKQNLLKKIVEVVHLEGSIGL
jgi:hypothetical protein